LFIVGSSALFFLDKSSPKPLHQNYAYDLFITLLRVCTYYKSKTNQDQHKYQPEKKTRKTAGVYGTSLRDPVVKPKKSRATISKRLHPDSMAARCSSVWR
jgi:hypothetical protein